MRLKIHFYEGHGLGEGKDHSSGLHPYGRLNALMIVYDQDDQEIFRSQRCSTLPDDLSELYAKDKNNGLSIPIVKDGEYDIYLHYHKYQKTEKNRAFRMDNRQGFIPVYREGETSKATGINIHYAYPDTYGMSTGCILVHIDDMMELMDIVHGEYDSFNEDGYAGKVYIHREGTPYDVINFIEDHSRLVSDKPMMYYYNIANYVMDNPLVTSEIVWCNFMSNTYDLQPYTHFLISDCFKFGKNEVIDKVKSFAETIN